MAYSTQRVESDGTLELLPISIKYFDRSEITVFFDGVLEEDGWSWVGETEKSIMFSPAVPEGVDVIVRRTTDISKPRHEFTLGAAFTTQSMDEDLQQVLHIAQEAKEGSGLGEVYQDLDHHGFKAVNIGAGEAPGDAVNVGQLEVHNSVILGHVQDASDFADAAEASAIAAASSASSLDVDVLMHKDANLGDVADAAAARTSLGLGDSATGDIGVDVQAYDSKTAKTDEKQTFTAQQTPMGGALTDGATVNWNADTNGQVVKITLGGNRTMGAPTNIVEGTAYMLRVKQDATGSRTLTWNAAYKFGGSGAPTLTTTANKVDWLSFIGGASNTLEYLGIRKNAV